MRNVVPLTDTRNTHAERLQWASDLYTTPLHDLDPYLAAKLVEYLKEHSLSHSALLRDDFQMSLACWTRAHDLVNDDCEDAHARTRRSCTSNTLIETIARNYTMEEATLVRKNGLRGEANQINKAYHCIAYVYNICKRNYRTHKGTS